MRLHQVAYGPRRTSTPAVGRRAVAGGHRRVRAEHPARPRRPGLGRDRPPPARHPDHQRPGPQQPLYAAGARGGRDLPRAAVGRRAPAEHRGHLVRRHGVLRAHRRPGRDPRPRRPRAVPGRRGGRAAGHHRPGGQPAADPSRPRPRPASGPRRRRPPRRRPPRAGPRGRPSLLRPPGRPRRAAAAAESSTEEESSSADAVTVYVPVERERRARWRAGGPPLSAPAYAVTSALRAAHGLAAAEDEDAGFTALTYAGLAALLRAPGRRLVLAADVAADQVRAAEPGSPFGKVRGDRPALGPGAGAVRRRAGRRRRPDPGARAGRRPAPGRGRRRRPGERPGRRLGPALVCPAGARAAPPDPASGGRASNLGRIRPRTRSRRGADAMWVLGGRLCPCHGPSGRAPSPSAWSPSR